MQRKEKVRVYLDDGRGVFTTVYEGTCRKAATEIRDLLRKQQTKAKPLLVVQH